MKTRNNYRYRSRGATRISPRSLVRRVWSAGIRKLQEAVITLMEFMFIASMCMLPFLAIASVVPDPELAYKAPPEAQNATLKARIIISAREHGVDEDLALLIVKNETGFTDEQMATTSDYLPIRGDQKILKNGHGKCTNKKSSLYGKPANARGIFQLTECWAHLSDEDADNVDTAIEYSMKLLADGRCYLWSTCPKELALR